MPSAVIHLLVARKILDSLMVTELSIQSLFYAGSIAPDSAHAKKNYTRACKVDSHFRTGIKGIEIYEEKNIKLMYERIDVFMNENYKMKNKFLYLGYIVHILTDLHYQWTVKKEYIEEMSKRREFIDHIDFYKEMIDDERDVSKQLLVSYPVLDDIKGLLLSCKDYSIHPLFTCEELQRAKNWTIQMKLDNNSSINETTFVTYNRILDFIDDSSNKILQELSPYIT